MWVARVPVNRGAAICRPSVVAPHVGGASARINPSRAASDENSRTPCGWRECPSWRTVLIHCAPKRRTPCGWRECPFCSARPRQSHTVAPHVGGASARIVFSLLGLMLLSRTPCGWRECPRRLKSSTYDSCTSHPMWVARVPENEQFFSYWSAVVAPHVGGASARR